MREGEIIEEITQSLNKISELRKTIEVVHRQYLTQHPDISIATEKIYNNLEETSKSIIELMHIFTDHKNKFLSETQDIITALRKSIAVTGA